MKKNDTVQLKITAMTSEGSGIGRDNGLAVFVPGTAIGDEVSAHIIKVKSKHAIGRLNSVLVPSPARREVDCPAFKSCGGCALRHIHYSEQLAVKQQIVADAIQRIGHINLAPEPIVPSPCETGYRNKAQYPVAQGENGIVYGFFARHSHRVIEAEACKLQPPVFAQAMQVFKAWADKYSLQAYQEQTRTGLLRHVLLRYAETTNQLLVTPVVAQANPPYMDNLAEMLQQALGDTFKTLCYNINTADTNVVLGERFVTVSGPGYITDTICSVPVRIAPQSFYQVNRAAAEQLYRLAASYIEPDDRVLLDLFCGIGSIGLSLLQLCGSADKQLIGVEIIEQAVQNARENAKAAGFENCTFLCGDAGEAAVRLRQDNIRPDVVIVDPPRKGCDAGLLQTICTGFAPNKLIYISCDPSTLARDVQLASDYGYTLRQYTPVDLFPGTTHVECVTLLTRTEK